MEASSWDGDGSGFEFEGVCWTSLACSSAAGRRSGVWLVGLVEVRKCREGTSSKQEILTSFLPFLKRAKGGWGLSKQAE